MQVYFSAIPEDCIQGDETFVDAEGTTYYFTVGDSDFCEDEFVVADGCGRFVPFELGALDSLIDALESYRAQLLADLESALFSEPDSIVIVD